MRKKLIVMVTAFLMCITMVASACGSRTTNSSSKTHSRQSVPSTVQPSVVDSSSETISAVVPEESSGSASVASQTSPSQTSNSVETSTTISNSEEISTTTTSSASSSSAVSSSSIEILNPTPISGTSISVTPSVNGQGNTSASLVTPEVNSTTSSGSTSTGGSTSTSSSIWLPDIYDYDNVTPDYGTYDDSVKYNYSGVTYTAKQGSFTTSGTSYTTSAGNTIAVNTSVPFPYGSLSADLTYKGGDSGLIFGYTNTGTATWEGSGISFYFLFINDRNFHLGKSDNGTWSTLGTQCMGTNDTNHTYNLRVVVVSNKIICMIDNLVAFTVVDSSFLTSTGFGFRVGTSGTVFSNVQVTNEYDFESEHYVLDNGYNYTYPSTFTTLQGTFSLSGTTHTASADSSIMVNTTPFRYGSIQVDMTSPNTGDNGIVFGYTNWGTNTWEGANMSYYFLFVNYQGIVILGKSDLGAWSTVAQSNGVVVRDFSVSHKLLLVYKEREITVYLDDAKLFTAVDPAPLFGAGYGIRAGNSGAMFANFTITSDYLK